MEKMISNLKAVKKEYSLKKESFDKGSKEYIMCESICKDIDEIIKNMLELEIE